MERDGDDYEDLCRAIDTPNNNMNNYCRTYTEYCTVVTELYERRDALCSKLLNSQEDCDHCQILTDIVLLDVHIQVLEKLMCGCKREVESSIHQIGIAMETDRIIYNFRTMSDMPPSKKTKLDFV